MKRSLLDLLENGDDSDVDKDVAGYTAEEMKAMGIELPAEYLVSEPASTTGQESVKVKSKERPKKACIKKSEGKSISKAKQALTLKAKQPLKRKPPLKQSNASKSKSVRKSPKNVAIKKPVTKSNKAKAPKTVPILSQSDKANLTQNKTLKTPKGKSKAPSKKMANKKSVLDKNKTKEMPPVIPILSRKENNAKKLIDNVKKTQNRWVGKRKGPVRELFIVTSSHPSSPQGNTCSVDGSNVSQASTKLLPSISHESETSPQHLEESKSLMKTTKCSQNTTNLSKGLNKSPTVLESLPCTSESLPTNLPKPRANHARPKSAGKPRKVLTVENISSYSSLLTQVRKLPREPVGPVHLADLTHRQDFLYHNLTGVWSNVYDLGRLFSSMSGSFLTI